MWAALAAAAALAATSQADLQCYDALVWATTTEQTPTALMCDLCTAWPYIDVLDVKRVMRGHAPLGELTVLSIQHTYYKVPRSGGRWWLRRNTSGGYNVLRVGDDPAPPLCSKAQPPARPYVSPADGQTMDDLKRAGDRRYGHMGDRVYYPNAGAPAGP